jgi:hypothetical protein
VTREARNLSVLKDRNQLHHAEERPAGGKGAKGSGAGSTTRCKNCHQPGHPSAFVPYGRRKEAWRSGEGSSLSCRTQD